MASTVALHYPSKQRAKVKVIVACGNQQVLRALIGEAPFQVREARGPVSQVGAMLMRVAKQVSYPPQITMSTTHARHPRS